MREGLIYQLFRIKKLDNQECRKHGAIALGTNYYVELHCRFDFVDNRCRSQRQWPIR